MNVQQSVVRFRLLLFKNMGTPLIEHKVRKTFLSLKDFTRTVFYTQGGQ